MECAGTFEVEAIRKDSGEPYEFNDFSKNDDVNIHPVAPSTSSIVTQSSKRRRIETQENKKYKKLSDFDKPKWTQRKNGEGKFEYDISPMNEPLDDVKKKLADSLSGKTPQDLFSLFFDDEVLDMIIEETNRYAQQKNSNFVLDNIMLQRFLGILVLSGYHTVPAARDYWSNHPTLGVPAVKLCMPRNKFLDIKKFIHFSNNFNLDKNDKIAYVLFNSLEIYFFIFILFIS